MITSVHISPQGELHLPQPIESLRPYKVYIGGLNLLSPFRRYEKQDANGYLVGEWVSQTIKLIQQQPMEKRL